jgi:hypothetical protein
LQETVTDDGESQIEEGRGTGSKQHWEHGTTKTPADLLDILTLAGVVDIDYKTDRIVASPPPNVPQGRVDGRVDGRL